MAGLIAANMLRRFQPVVLEAQGSLPNNHEALLRFRSDAVSRATGIPFRKVLVHKAISDNGWLTTTPNLRYSNMYSLKVTGEVTNRSILLLDPVERYIAPPDFIQQVSRSCNIEYSTPLTDVQRSGEGDDSGPVISTIPMNYLMDISKWPTKPEFKYKSIWSVWVEFDSPKMDIHQTVYYPDPDVPYYRASITGNRFILEYIREPESDKVFKDACNVINDFGIKSPTITSPMNIQHQKFGKLLPIDERERRRFILAMTDMHRVYSLGRFSTWRQILMDDVVKDVAKMEEWITERDEYAARLRVD